ncbi:protein IWS1 homolog [Ornithodoros turicata]|uniref:protein IWS1 homolog n=1 Tax=Ornithodoros turicata TaxID=34597 RepID=UPI003138F388
MSNSTGSDVDAGSDDEQPGNVASPSPAASVASDDERQSDADSDDDKSADNRSEDEEGSQRGNAEEGNQIESDAEGDNENCDAEEEKEDKASDIQSPRSKADDDQDGRHTSMSDHSKGDEGIAEEDEKEVTRSDEEHDNESAKGDSDDEDGPSSPKRDSDDGDKSDKDDSDNESNVGELIANIFGESDESDFEGFGPEDLVSPKKKDKGKKAKKTVLSDSEDEDDIKEKPVDVGSDQVEKKAEDDEDMRREGEGEEEEEKEAAPASAAPSSAKPAPVSSSDDEMDDARRSRSDFISDFDLMMAKKKEESSRRRRRRDVDIISDTDDIIADIIKEMKIAADEDKELNKNKQAATKKLKFLPVVASQLKKMDLKIAFLDQGVLHVMAEWLSPLPDKSLPHLTIREFMLKLLAEFPPLDQGILKSSGIGRAVMYLYKHPKETKENREKAGKLINEWARPIFNLNTNYSSISKEEREQKDFERMPQKRKLRLESSDEPPSKKDIDKALTGEDKSLRPGEKGWVARARVPMPSTKDYVVRPKWNCDTEFVKNTKKTVTRLDRHMRQFQERKKKGKSTRAVTISIEGRHMAL